MTLHLGECDACQAVRPLRLVATSHGECSACAICRGGDPLDMFEEFNELYDEVNARREALMRKDE